MEKELRYQPVASPTIETRENGKEVISGMGVVFGQRSEKLGFFYEYIDKDAFRDTDTSDVVGLFNHNYDYVLGRTQSGTMRFNIEVDGVRYEIDAPETQLIRDLVLAPMRRGDIRGSSFGFSISENGDEWEYNKEADVYTRYIKKIERLYDLSPVTNPAYIQTSSGVAKRSLDQFIEDTKRQEEEAKRALSHYRRSIAQKQLLILQ